MRFVGKKPVMVQHRKLGGEAECLCGAKLKQEDGEWVHPEIVNPKPKVVPGKDEFNSEFYVSEGITGTENLTVTLHFAKLSDRESFLNWWVLGKRRQK